MLWLVILISFLGLVIGLILGKVAEEELVPGEKYFKLLKRIILIVLVIGLLYYSWQSYSIVIAFIIGFLIAMFIRKLYLYFGLALFLSFFISKEFILLVSMLIFIYGLVYGSFLKKKKLLFYNLILFLLPFLLFFVREFVISYLYLFLAFSSGCLFRALISKDL